MKDRHTLTYYFAFVLILFITQSVFAQEGQLTVIGNMESVPAELTMKALKSAMRGERQKWEDGVSIKIALMKTSTPIGVLTAQKIYGMTGNELNKYFLALVFQGKAKAPVFFSSPGEMEKYVAENPGAIGVLQTTTDSQIKIIAIDGNNQIQ